MRKGAKIVFAFIIYVVVLILLLVYNPGMEAINVMLAFVAVQTAYVVWFVTMAYINPDKAKKYMVGESDNAIVDSSELDLAGEETHEEKHDQSQYVKRAEKPGEFDNLFMV